MSVIAGQQIVTFRLGEDLFAADINEVERVLRYAEPTPVPNVPDWVQGVIEYRSRVVPVIDLRTRFELPAGAPNGATRLMVLTSDGEWIAAVVDAVLEVVAIGTAPLAPPPPLFKGMSADFLKGILRRSERLIIVLDVARLLATKDRLAFDPQELATIPAPEDAPAETADDARTGAGPASAERIPPPLAASEANGDITIIRGSADPAVGGFLPLLGTNEDAPRPDESILRNGPAVPPTPEWGAPPSLRPQGSGSDDEGSSGTDG